MDSLSAHLAAGLDHGRLHFHPDCPICREQGLAGARSDAVLPARARAGLLAAALGMNTLVPSSVAAAGDPGNAPTAETSQAPASAPAPVQESPPSPPEQPSLGTDETQEAPVDEAPQVRDLLTNPEAGTDIGGEDVSGEGEETPPMPPPLGQAPAEPEPVEVTPAPLGEPPAQPPPVGTPPAPAQPTPTPVPQPPPAPAEPSPAADVEQLPIRHRDGARAESKTPRQIAPASRPAARATTQSEAFPQRGDVPPPVDAVVQPPTTTTSISQTPEPSSSRITGRSYTVRPGDSLWSIAGRLLGRGASDDRVARVANRLWEVNRDRIGTGDASLIYAGTVLRLP